MSAQVTEAHRALASIILLPPVTVESAAQRIADSEARAVEAAMLREYGNLSATNEALTKERDGWKIRYDKASRIIDKLRHANRDRLTELGYTP